MFTSADIKVRQFFAHGIPIECYPIIGVTACVLSFATFSISRHVIQDRDHVSNPSYSNYSKLISSFVGYLEEVGWNMSQVSRRDNFPSDWFPLLPIPLE